MPNIKTYFGDTSPETSSHLSPEFASHRLNETGIKKVELVKQDFNRLLLAFVAEYSPEVFPFGRIIPEGRYLSIVKTKLEEACMFAVKAVASDPVNQEAAR